MAEESAQSKEELPEIREQEKQKGPQKAERSELSRKLDAAGWGSFLIWLGIVLWVGADTSVALLGIGIIMVGVQVARLVLKLHIEGFWLVIGLLFVAGGIWQLIDTRLPLVPILLIVAGLALMLTKFLPRHRD
jgi:hypothetical protein